MKTRSKVEKSLKYPKCTRQKLNVNKVENNVKLTNKSKNIFELCLVNYI